MTQFLTLTTTPKSPPQGWQPAGWSLDRPDFGHCAVASSDTELLVISGQGHPAGMEVTLYNVVSGARASLTSPNGTGGAHLCTRHQAWKLLRFNQSQELSQIPYMAPDWMHKSRQPIASQVSVLTKLLTLINTQTFPSQDAVYVSDFLEGTVDTHRVWRYSLSRDGNL